jgi:hypothetical protein
MDVTPIHDGVRRGTPYLQLHRAGDGVVVQRVNPDDDLPDFWPLWLKARIERLVTPQDGLVVNIQDDTVVVLSALDYDDMVGLVRACMSGIQPSSHPVGRQTISDDGATVTWRLKSPRVVALLRSFKLPDGARLRYDDLWASLSCTSECETSVFDLAEKLEQHIALGI